MVTFPLRNLIVSMVWYAMYDKIILEHFEHGYKIRVKQFCKLSNLTVYVFNSCILFS